MGNHEQMMLSARDDGGQAAREWQVYGGRETLDSYDGGLAQVPESHWLFIESGLGYWETPTHIFVHGGLYPDVALVDQPRHQLLWGRFDQAQPHISGKIMVCGHTSQKNGRPANKGFAYCIDTYAHGGQWLSCLDIDTGIVHQFDIDGEYREVNIADFLDK